jgi:hypothetical protein
MKTMYDYFEPSGNLTERTLKEVTKQIQTLGNIKVIRGEVSKEVFAFYIAVRVIGNWRDDGWWGVLAEQPELVPYIAESFETFRLQHLKAQFEKVLELFPPDASFKSDDEYYEDILNFLRSSNNEVKNDRLRELTEDEHALIVNQVKERLKQLEQLTDPLFGDEDDEDRWDVVYEFIQKSMAH